MVVQIEEQIDVIKCLRGLDNLKNVLTCATDKSQFEIIR